MEKKKLINTVVLMMIFCCTHVVTWAQQQSLPMHLEHRLNYEKHLYKTDQSKPFHTSIKPYVESEVYQHVYPDSTYGLKKIQATSGFKKAMNTLGYEDWIRFDEKGFIKSTETVIIDGDTLVIPREEKEYKKRKFYIAANPIFHFSIGKGNNKNESSYNLRGLELKANIGEKVSIYSAFLENQAVFPEYTRRFVIATRTAPSQGKVRNFKNNGFDFSQAIGHINYTPNQYFAVELGHGKHFIGDGYRSLLLSDNAFSYPYLKFITKFWRFKYVNIYTELLNDIKTETDFTLGFPKKLANFNYLSLSATPWLSLGVFEGLIWRSTRADGKRAFDANFLNPIIGIRAMQKNLDANKLYGFNASIHLPKHIVLYGQVAINEFSTDLKSVDNRTGMQVGAKYYDAFGLKNLNLLAEYNIVRPHTYQNSKDSVLHYSHYNQALAHPMGAGFDEFVFWANYRYKRFVTSLKINGGRSSVDGPALNVGTNVMLSKSEADFMENPSIGQGLFPYKVFNGEFSVGYILNPKINMVIEARAHIRKYKTDSGLLGLAGQNANNLDLQLFSIGLNTKLFNYYYDVPIHF